MKRTTRKSLLQASKLSYNRRIWQDLVELKDLIEWSATKADTHVPPPLPFKKPKHNYISLILP